MVAVVTGTGLGLERSSAWVLGSRGQLGQATLGRGADNVYVNAATGNLVIQGTDDILAGIGEDAQIARAYNSLGSLNDDNGDNWRESVSRLVVLTSGTVNTAGSIVTRTDWDGSEVQYAWDAGRSAYVSTAGAGAHDTITHAGSTWTWTDGSSRVSETYDEANGGRITGRIDADLNTQSFSYDSSGRLASITMPSSGEHVDFTWSGNDLTQVSTWRKADAASSPTQTTRVRYGYDTSHRLTTVTVDLTPDDNSVSDGATYVTTYTYDGTSRRVASITETDGSSVAIGYTQIGGVYLVTSLVQSVASGVTRTTTFGYDTGTRTTTVTDPLGLSTSLTYDASGQLTKLTAASGQVTQFGYNANGDLTALVAADGAAVAYDYDANGNCISEIDAAGDTITRTYSAHNQLLTETRYQTASASGSPATGAMTTRYAYDAEDHLRFVISAEGDVTEYRYNTAGQVIAQLTLATTPYDLTGLAANVAPSESTLATWVSGLNLSGAQRTDTSYDYRGDVSTVTRYGKTLSSGAGDTTATTEIATTTYVYDAAGRLLSRLPSGLASAEHYVYDGLGRQVSRVDLLGQTTTTAFNDASGQTEVHEANGLICTSTYNKAGELVSYAESGSGVTTATTTYAYDAAGRLRMVTDATGAKTYSLYDAAGRKVADIAADGTLTEYRYTVGDLVNVVIAYKTKLTSTQLASLVDSGGAPAAVSIGMVRPSADAADRWAWSIYDSAQRLVETIDATGAAVVYAYDGASRRTSSVAYGTRFDATALAAFKTTPPLVPLSPGGVVVSANAAPVANADGTFNVAVGGTLIFDPRTNDTDAEGDRLQILGIVSGPSKGVATVVDGVSIKYVVSGSATTGSDSLTYRIGDGHGNVATATVSFNIVAATVTNGFYQPTIRQKDTGFTGTSIGSSSFDVPASMSDSAIMSTPGGTSFTYEIDITEANTSSALIGVASQAWFDGGARWSLSIPGSALWYIGHNNQFGDDSGTTATWTNPTATLSAGDVVGVTYSASTRTMRIYKNGGLIGTLVLAASLASTQIYPVLSSYSGRLAGAYRATQSSYASSYAMDSGGTNTAPVGNTDSYATIKNTPLTFDPRTNDTDADYNGLTIASFQTTTAHGGTVAATGNGGLIYTPPLDYTGSDSFTYTLTDGTATTGPITVNLTVGAAVSGNHAPVAANDGTLTVWTGAGGTVVFDPRTNDTDADGDALQIIAISGAPTLGTATIVDGVSIKYTVNAGVTSGTDTLTYRIADGKGGVATATVSFYIDSSTAGIGFYQPTIRQKDSGFTGTTGSSSFDVPSSLNDYAIMSTPPTASFTYEIDVTQMNAGAGNIGVASQAWFDAGASYSSTTAGVAEWYVSNDYIFGNPSGTTVSWTDAYKTLSAGDVVGVTYSASTRKMRIYKNGSLIGTLTLASSLAGTQMFPIIGSWSSRMAGGFRSTASSYAANYAMDGVTAPPNTAPTGVADSYATLRNTPLTIDPRTNDSDADSNPLTISSFQTTSAHGGTITATGHGALIYTPPVDYTGADSFTYVLSDGTVVTSSINVSISVNAPTSVTSPGLATPGAGDRVTRNFYDKDDRLVAVLDAEGFLSTIRYDAAGEQVETIAYATATTESLRLAGTLAQLLTSVGTSSSDIHNWFLYDGRGQLRAAIDGEGDLTRYHYSAQGDLDQMVRGEKLTVSTLLTTPPTLAGLPSITTTPTIASAAAIETTAYARNAMGQVTTETKTLAGGTAETTTYTYDTQTHRLLSQTTAASTSDARTQAQIYDLRGRLVGALNGVGAAALAALSSPTDAQRAAIYLKYGVTYAYDAEDRMISKTESDGVDGSGDRTLYYYDANGRLTYVVNPKGEVTQYGYDSFGERTDTTLYGTRIATGLLATLTGGAITSALTSAITANSALDSHVQAAFDLDGRLASTTDALGAVTTYDYDAFGDLTKRTDPLATSVTRATSWTYDRRGLAKTEVVDSDAGGLALSTAFGYDAFGRQVSTTDANGHVTAAGYDRAGRVVSRTDALSVTSTYSYDGRGALISQTDRTGKTTSYAYTAFDRQVVVTTPEGIVATTAKNAYGQTVSVTDGAGRTTSWTYDKDGHVARVTDGAGNHVDQAYDYDGRLATLTDARGVATTYSYDAANRLLSQAVDPAGLNLVTSYQYDAKGQAVQVTDPAGRVTQVAFDLNGRKTSVSVDPTGLNLTTTYQYDKAGRLLTLTEGAGGSAPKVTTYTYDKADRLTQTKVDPSGLAITTGYTYDGAGNVVARTDALGQVTRFAYDADDRLIYQVDPLGDVQKTSYDAEGRVTGKTAYATPVDSFTLATWGPMVTVAAVAGAVTAAATRDESTAFVYDGDGRLRFTVGATGLTVQYDYDGGGNLLHQIAYASAITTASSYSLAYVQAQVSGLSADTNNRTSRTVYDAAGRAAYGIDAQGAVTAFGYDPAGNLIKQTAFATAYTTAGDPSLSTIQAWATSHAADAGNRVTRTYYDKAGRPVYSVDGESYVTETRYDAAGRVTATIRYKLTYSVTDTTDTAALKAALPSSPPTNAQVLSYGYDTAGRLTDLTDGEGVLTHLALDAQGRVIDSTVAYGTSDAVTTHNTYDAAGRLHSRTLANGTSAAATTTYGYDALGRAVTETDADSHVTTRDYDALGHVTAVYAPIDSGTSAVTHNVYDAFGNLAKVTDPNGGQGFFYYDKLNRLVLQVDPEGYATATTYSLGGEVASVTRYANRTSGAPTIATRPTVTTSGSDATTSFQRDKLDRLTGTTDAEGYSESYTLNAFGDRVSVTNKLGGTTTYAYDRRGLKTSETLPVGSTKSDGTSAATSIVNTFTYDARHNLSVMVEASNIAAEARTTQFFYDHMDRQIQKVGDDVQVYSQDLVTNPIITPTQFTYYDARGNVIESKDATLARTLFYYDAQNRKIAQIDPTGALTTWTYDAVGNVLSQRTYGDLVTLPTSPGGSPPSPVSATNYRETTYSYDRSNRLVATTQAGALNGAWVGSSVTSGSYVSQTSDLVTTNTYDAAGNLTRQTFPDGTTNFFFYDKLGRKIAQVDQGFYLTSYTLDAEGNVLTEERFATKLTATVTTASDPAALRAAVTGNAADRITTFTYDRDGRRLTENRLNVAYATVNATTGAVTIATGTATITYTYNGLGEVTSKTEATGDRTDYTYDLIGRQLTETDAAINNYLSLSERKLTSYFYNGLNNLARMEVSNLGHTNTRVTTYAYNKAGWLTEVRDPIWNDKNAPTSTANPTHAYGYNAVGKQVADIYDRTVTTSTTPVREARTTHYDAAGRVVWQSVQTKTGSTWDSGDYTEMRYNAFGEMTARGLNGGFQETWDYDKFGRIWRTTAGDGERRFFLYDAMGHQTLMMETAGAGSTASVASEDEVIAYLTGSGAHTAGSVFADGVIQTITTYNQRGQANGTIEPFRELVTVGTTDTNITTNRTYNAFGEVDSEVDRNGATTTYQYNTLGRLTQTTLPAVHIVDDTGTDSLSNPVTHNAYDISGRLVATQDAAQNGTTVWTSRTLLAGTGYGGEDALATAEFHPDGGVARTGYNVFNDAIIYADELGALEVRSYDKLDHVTSVTHATSASDLKLLGTAASETIDSQGIYHYVQGNGGNDTYIFNKGYGRLELYHYQAFLYWTGATLKFGDGITLSDLKFEQGFNGDLIIAVGTTGDEVHVDAEFNSSYGAYSWGIAGIQFASGATLSRQQIVDIMTTGSATNKNLYGWGGDDTLDSKGLAHYAQGNGGGDTYVYNQGYGALEINHYAGINAPSYAVLQFGEGITADNLTFRHGMGTDLIISDGIAGDQINLDLQFNYSYGAYSWGVGSFRFHDGSTLSLQQVVNRMTSGSATNTNLIGWGGNDTIDSHGLAHYAQGNGGGDVYVFNSGYGKLEINHYAGINAPSWSVLQFGPGITAANLTFERYGNDLIIGDGTPGDEVYIDLQFNTGYGAYSWGVGSIRFSDNSTMSLQQISDRLTSGSATNPYLVGWGGNDTLDSHGLAHYAQGNGGADTYVFNAGYGQLEINHYAGLTLGSTAIVQFGPGITAANLTVRRDPYNNLSITDGVAGDVIWIDNEYTTQYGANPWGIGGVRFNDSTTLTRDQLLALAVPVGGTLYGTSGADTLSGGGGTYALLQGGAGADVYTFSAGDGVVEVLADAGHYGTSAATLRVTGSLTMADFDVSLDPSGHLWLVRIGSADRIRIDYELTTGYSGQNEYGIVGVTFDSGGSYTRAQLLAMAMNGTPLRTSIFGTGGADTIDSLGHSTFVQGGAGADVYVYNAGYGVLEINSDAGGYNTSASTIHMGGGLTASQVKVWTDGTNLYLDDGVSGDFIKIDNEFARGNIGQEQYGVTAITFDSGPSLTKAQLRAMATDGQNGRPGQNGTWGNDTLDGHGYTTFVQGNGGSDVYVYNPGYGPLEINSDAGGYNTSTSILHIGGGVTASQVKVWTEGTNLFLTDQNGTDFVKIDNEFVRGNIGQAQYGVTQIDFDSGPSLTKAQLLLMATDGTGLGAGVYGTWGNETLDGHGDKVYMQGNGGADAYVYSAGYGRMQISSDAGGYTTNTSILRLHGVTADQLRVTIDGSNNMYLTDAVGGDLIRIDSQNALGSGGYRQFGVASVVLDDGTVLTRDQLTTLAQGGTILTDTYTYDELGQRLTHTNSQLGSAVKETIDYDRLGRVIRQTDFDGHVTTNSYAWNSSIVTDGMTGGSTGVSAYGGWVRTTTNSSGLTSTEKRDYFGRVVASTDFGGNTYAYTYNYRGQLVAQTSASTGQNLTYTYFNTGKLATTTDLVASSGAIPRNVTSNYTYDANGNRKTETYVGTYTFFDWTLGNVSYNYTYESSSADYDALNRMTHYTDTGQNNALPAMVDYKYDANGNVREAKSTYRAIGATTDSTQDYWYTYDNMNRVAITEGQLVNAGGTVVTTPGAGTHIVVGATGMLLGYDKASRRISASNLTDDIEAYTYTSDGYLKTVTINTKLRSKDDRDAMGRILAHTEYQDDGVTVAYSRNDTYYNDSRVNTETSFTRMADGTTYAATSTFGYDGEISPGVTRFMGGLVTSIATSTVRTPTGGSTTTTNSTTNNTYGWWDRAQIVQTKLNPDTSHSTVNTSTYTYDADSHLTKVEIQDGRPRTVTYVTDAAGQILSRQESSAASANPQTFYYDFNGMRLGEVSNNGAGPTQIGYAKAIANRQATPSTGAFSSGSAVNFADFDQSYDPINPSNRGEGQASSTYTVHDGDTLQSIAAAVFGDSSLWWLIADANGLNGTENLQPGLNLQIPAKVTNLHNTSQTFRVYDPNDAIGDVAPNQPAPVSNKKKGCGGLGQILVAIIAIAVAFVVAPYAVAGLTGGSVVGGTTVAGVTIGGTVAGGATGLAGFAGAVAGSAIGGAVGSIVGQGVGVAIGVQDSIDWKGVGLAAITAGVGGGIADVFGPASSLPGLIARQAATDVIGQGIGIATGLQQKFDWAAVAVSAVATFAGAEISPHIPTFGLGKGAASVVNVALSGTAGLIAGAATRTLITGSDFGDNIRAGLPNAIGATVGAAVGEVIKATFSGKSSGGYAKTAEPSVSLTQMPQVDFAADTSGIVFDADLMGSPQVSFGSIASGYAPSTARTWRNATASAFSSATSSSSASDLSVLVGVAANGDTVKVGRGPATTVGDETEVAPVTVTGQPRSLWGLITGGVSAAIHGNWNTSGADFRAAGSRIANGFMATDAVTHYGRRLGMSISWAGAGLRAEQKSFNTQRNTVVAPMVNRELGALFGGTILVGATGGLAAAWAPSIGGLAFTGEAGGGFAAFLGAEGGEMSLANAANGGRVALAALPGFVAAGYLTTSPEQRQAMANAINNMDIAKGFENLPGFEALKRGANVMATPIASPQPSGPVGGGFLPEFATPTVLSTQVVDDWLVGPQIYTSDASSVGGSAIGISNSLPTVFDGEFATQQLLGTTTTPGGRQIMFHAADRMVNPPPGRAPMSPADIDQVLDGATSIDKMSYHPQGDTLTIRNANMPGSPRVIVDAATGKRVITVVNPRVK